MKQTQLKVYKLIYKTYINNIEKKLDEISFKIQGV